MPITPFHFGPGVLIKAVAGSGFSWTTFALANCLIDLEPILYFFTTGIPSHRYMHTLPGVTLAGLLSYWPGIFLCRWWLVRWNQMLSPAQHRFMGVSAQLSPTAALVGAMLGGWSHLWLDAVMHGEVKPFWPFSLVNPLASVYSVEKLHLICLVSAGLGLTGLLLRRLKTHFQG